MLSGEESADDSGGGTSLKDKKDPSGGKKPFFRHGSQKPVVPRQPKFEGRCEELKGHIYDFSDAR